MGTLATVAMCVTDITRSTAYLFPSLFVALRILAAREEPIPLRRLILIACLISLAWPGYHIGGEHSIWWQYPLPLQVMRRITG